jgi:hypothetical protein
MPSAWSWYQSVAARCSFGYWKVADPGCQETPNFAAAFSAKNSYHVPTRANPLGMSTASGRYQASAYPSLSSPTPTAPCTCVTMGTGPS